MSQVAGVLGVLVAEDIGQALEEGASGAGIGGTGVHELAGVGLGPGEELGRGLGRVGDLVRIVGEHRPARAPDHGDAVALEKIVGGLGAGKVVVDRLLEGVRVLRHQLLVDVHVHARGHRVVAGEDEGSVEVAGHLLRLDLGRQLRRGELDILDVRHQFGVGRLEGLESGLGQREVARHVDDAELDGLGHRRSGRRRPRRRAPRRPAGGTTLTLDFTFIIASDLK